MAVNVSKSHRLAQVAAKKQAILMKRAEDAGMPPVIDRGIWERARQAFFGPQPLTHKQLLKHQMAEAGVE
jgi:hypothetical protein